MGVERNISFDKFPRQSDYVGQKTDVCFHYDTSKTIPAVIVRDDLEKPFLTIFKLGNGRYVLATECQYSFNPLMKAGLKK